MNVKLSCPSRKLGGTVQITGSKSESNRLLILQSLFPKIKITNLSNSDDTRVLQQALTAGEDLIDVHHAGTAMRFLTAYFATRAGQTVVLTGSPRMKERPVKVLVGALRDLGASITYLEKEGYPPLKIEGRALPEEEVRVQSNISSQYISALMLIAPALPRGLQIHLEGNVTSTPYIRMTLKFLQECGIRGTFEKNLVQIFPMEDLSSVEIEVESDWSSASYFYSLVALSEEADIRISSFKEASYQGDQVVRDIFRTLGVETRREGRELTLHKIPFKKPRSLDLDLSDAPDLAQTIAVTCLGLGLKCNLTGLHTLRIKETDRLEALQREVQKFGGRAEVTADSFHYYPSGGLEEGVVVETYNDHRMALSFAPLATKVPLQIRDAGVVSKSFPDFWEDCERLGLKVQENTQD